MNVGICNARVAVSANDIIRSTEQTHGLDVLLKRYFVLIIYVYSVESDLRIELRDFLELGCNQFAWTAPFCGEVYDNGLFGFDLDGNRTMSASRNERCVGRYEQRHGMHCKK